MQYSKEISDCIAEYLSRQGWAYEFDPLHGVFSVEADLRCKLSGVLLVTQVTTDSFVTYASVTETVPQTAQSLVGEYLHRANYGLPNGNFEFGYDGGDIQFKVFTDCAAGAPTAQQVENSCLIPLSVLEHYGDGLWTILHQGDSQAKQLIEQLDS